MKDVQLVFIVSQPRSGSTLLQRILFNHPKISSYGETWLLLPFLQGVTRRWARPETPEIKISRQNTQKFLENSGVGYEKCLELAGEYFEKIYAEASAEKVFIEKVPRYSYFLPELKRMFPSARFIFLLRDPESVFDSIYHKWAQKSFRKLKNYYDEIVISPNLIYDFLSNDSSGLNIHICHYTNLVRNPKKEIKKICEFLDIEYYPGLDNYKKNEGENIEWFGDDEVNKYSSPTNRTTLHLKRSKSSLKKYILKKIFLKKIKPEIFEFFRGSDY